MDDGEIIIGIILVLVIVFFVVRGIIKKRNNKIEETNTKANIRSYISNWSNNYIKENGITVSKDYTYYLEPDLPFARIVIDDIAKHVYAFSHDNRWYRMPYKIIRYCTIKQDVESTKLQGAVTGALLAGATGAVIGASAAGGRVANLALEFQLDDLNIPQVTIPLFLNGEGDCQKAEAFGNSVINAIEYIERHNGLS